MPDAPIDQIRLHFQDGAMGLLNVVIGLIMFGVALDIRMEDFARLLRSPKAPLVGLAAQFVLFPAATFLLTMLLRPTPSIALGMILVASCPGGNLSNFLTHLAKGNTPLSITMTAASTLIAIVATPLNFQIWGSFNPDTAALLQKIELDPMDMILPIMTILGVPLFLGMACAHVTPVWAARLHPIFKYLSILFFLALVSIIFAQNAHLFVEYIGWIALAVFLQNGAALAIGYALGRINRLEERDCRAIAIEVGIQNSALGLALVFSFFDGLGGMALIAGWWGIWHVVSGLSLATFWSYRDPEKSPVAGTTR